MIPSSSSRNEGEVKGSKRGCSLILGHVAVHINQNVLLGQYMHHFSIYVIDSSFNLTFIMFKLCETTILMHKIFFNEYTFMRESKMQVMVTLKIYFTLLYYFLAQN